MKVAGKQMGRLATKTVTLQRGEERHEFLLSALPLGFVDVILQDRVPLPVPPRNYIKDANGALMKDLNGFPVLEQPFETLSMRKARTEAIHLQGVAMAHEGLRGDKSVSFDAQVPTEMGRWPDFYRAIQQELVAAGFTTGELTYLVNEVRGLSEKKQKDVEAARDNFLSEGSSPPQAPAGASPQTPAAAPSST